MMQWKGPHSDLGYSLAVRCGQAIIITWLLCCGDEGEYTRRALASRACLSYTHSWAEGASCHLDPTFRTLA